MGKAIFVILVLLLLGASLGYLFVNKQSPSNKVTAYVRETLNIPTPTPMPLAEMTIPYLRSRDYKSSLGEQSVVERLTSYTSYLTSYTSDGFKVNGLLTIPTGTPPTGGWPAVVFIHGYIPPTQYQTQSQYYDYVDYLARNGLVVFKIDLRGHGNSEGEPGGAYYSSDYIIDALNARAALQSSSFVDPDNIGLWGHSMAGNVVFRSFVAQPEIKGVVIWAGAVYTYADMQKYGIDDNSYRPPQLSTPRANRRQQLFATHGQFNEDNTFWKQVAATNYLADVTGALEIHHAVDDVVVNVGYSRDLEPLLDSARIDNQVYEYPSGGHNISGNSFNLAMQRTVEFFMEKLR